MADVFHKNITTAQGIHIIQAYEVADASARASISSPDKGKVVNQTDDNSWWIATSSAPTFVRIDIDDAGDLTFDPSGSNLTATDTEAAIKEVQSNLENFNVGEGGFVNRTDSTLTYTAGTRTFQIAPASASFDFYVQGTKYTKSGAESLVWNDNEGMHYFYYDDTGTLTYTEDESLIGSQVIPTFAFVAALYWNATDGVTVLELDERHGRQMSGATHAYLHQTQGAQWVEGLALGNFDIDGNGDDESHAQFSVADGKFRDEDILFTVTNGDPQTLASIAQIPVLYRDGASGDWRKKTADNFPVIYNGDSTPYAGGRAAYNEFTGATWQLTEVSNNDYFLVHIFATNDTTNPVVAILGQNEYANLADAQEGATTEITSILFGALPSPEFCPIATVIFETDNGMSNTPGARTVSTTDGADYVDWRDARGGVAGGPGTSDPTMGGDISGTASAATVERIQGVGVTATAPSVADLMVYDGAEWTNPPVSGDVNMTSGGVFTVTALNGEAIQATAPSTGDILINDGAGNWNHYTVKQDLSMDTSGNFTVIGLQGRELHDAAPADGEVITWVAANNRYEPQPGGSGSTNATQIQGEAVDAATPTDAQILIYDGSVDNEWEPKSVFGDATISRDGEVTVAKVNGNAFGTGSPSNGDMLVWTGAEFSPVTTTGDWTMNGSANATVTAIQGNDVQSFTPTDGFGLAWNDSNSRYEEAELIELNGSGRVTGDIHFLDGNGNFVLPNYTGDPASLDDGQMFFNSTEQKVKVRDHNVKWWTIPWEDEVMLLDGSQAMTGDMDLGSNGIENVASLEMPNATSSGGLPAATGFGNIGLRIDGGSDRYGLYVSDGTDWVTLPVTVNSNGRYAGTLHFLDGVGRMTLPQFTSLPGSPLDDAEIVYDTVEDEVRVRNNTAAGWERLQMAQKINFAKPFYFPSNATADTYYGPRQLGDSSTGNPTYYNKSYGATGSPGLPVVSTAYPRASGFYVAESGEIKYIKFAVIAGGTAPNVEVSFAALKAQYDWFGDKTNGSSVLLVSSAELWQPDLDGDATIIDLTLSTTSVTAGEVIVPVISCDNADTLGGCYGHIEIGIEVNRGV